jgi:hypothetical protein
MADEAFPGFKMPAFTLASPSLSDRLDSVMPQIEEAMHRKNNPVIDVCEALKSYVEAFEAQLDQDHEVAVRLVSFGGAVQFHAEQIGFSKPNVITFYGVTAEGERVQLIQHVSQLSFLLQAAKKLGETPRRIGFIQ